MNTGNIPDDSRHIAHPGIMFQNFPDHGGDRDHLRVHRPLRHLPRPPHHLRLHVRLGHPRLLQVSYDNIQKLVKSHRFYECNASHLDRMRISLDGVLFKNIQRSVTESQRKKEIWACGLAKAVTYLSVITSRIDNVTRRVLFIFGRGEWKYGAVKMGNCHTYSLLYCFSDFWLRNMPCPLHVWLLVQLDLSSQSYFMLPSFWWSWENCEFSWFCETGNVDR